MPKAKRKRQAKQRLQPAPRGPGEQERPEALAQRGSVQDPLEDWPDDDEARWLRERAGNDVEKPQD